MTITFEGVVAAFSFAGLVLSMGWNIRNLKHSNKEEIAKQAAKDENIKNSLDKTATDISEIKNDVKSIDGKIESIAQKQNVLDKELSSVQESVKSAHKRIDEIRQK